jgi:hypothetical protein
MLEFIQIEMGHVPMKLLEQALSIAVSRESDLFPQLLADYLSLDHVQVIQEP